jgi:purine-nucleoside phosphorylase
MIGHPLDVVAACALAELPPKSSRALLLSRLHYKRDSQPSYSIIGPFIGAPYAVMMFETVVAWGIREIVFWGWCGAVSSDVHIGDIIVPDRALVDEGTSRHYASHPVHESRPSYALQNLLKTKLSEKNILFHEGAVWTTDAIFRETPQKIANYKEKGALAVDMETSALFTAGKFRDVAIGGLLVVSDEVSSGRWVPGFSSPKFAEARQYAGGIVSDFLKNKILLDA